MSLDHFHCTLRGRNPHSLGLRPLLLRSMGAKTFVCLLALNLGLIGIMRGEGANPEQLPPVEPEKADVHIDNFSFSPNEITVAAGTTVRWTNDDDVPHVVASADRQFKKSPPLDSGESFSYRFSTAGSYTYFCSLHPHMIGKIIVTER